MLATTSNQNPADLIPFTGEVPGPNDPLSPNQNRQIADWIISSVCRCYQITEEEIKSPARPHRIAWPRQIAMWLVRRKCRGLTYPAIGEIFHRDHGTVIHAFETVAYRYREQRQTIVEINDLLKRYHIILQP